jgi:hypothetical protein
MKIKPSILAPFVLGLMGGVVVNMAVARPAGAQVPSRANAVLHYQFVDLRSVASAQYDKADERNKATMRQMNDNIARAARDGLEIVDMTDTFVPPLGGKVGYHQVRVALIRRPF